MCTPLRYLDYNPYTIDGNFESAPGFIKSGIVKESCSTCCLEAEAPKDLIDTSRIGVQ